jgi:predicted transport protein
MPHYKFDKDILKSIEEKPFKLEKEIQTLVESNLDLLFDLKFVRTEFQLNDLRIDSLAYDRQSKSFVIIEYKKDKRFSVIDQGFAYLSLMLNNKADFILECNEQTESVLKKNDVDWTQSKIIFISQSFTNYQKQAISFKDLPIELWEIKKYEDSSISLNQLVSPTSSESIRTLSKAGTVVEKVSKEVKKYTEEDHISKIPENIIDLYTRFKEMVLAISDSVSIRPRKLYVGFVAKRNFTDVVVQKSQLKIFLNLSKGTLDDPSKLARDISNVGHWGNGDYEISFSTSDKLEYILSLVKQAYLKNKRKDFNVKHPFKGKI